MRGIRACRGIRGNPPSSNGCARTSPMRMPPACMLRRIHGVRRAISSPAACVWYGRSTCRLSIILRLLLTTVNCTRRRVLEKAQKLSFSFLYAQGLEVCGRMGTLARKEEAALSRHLSYPRRHDAGNDVGSCGLQLQGTQARSYAPELLF